LFCFNIDTRSLPHLQGRYRLHGAASAKIFLAIETAVLAAGQPEKARATGISAYLRNGGRLEVAQQIALRNTPAVFIGLGGFGQCGLKFCLGDWKRFGKSSIAREPRRFNISKMSCQPQAAAVKHCFWR
jgi:hypothetical protein